MIRKKRKFTIPEYREKQEIYELLGYKELWQKEKGHRVVVTFEIDNTSKNYHKLKKIEREINVKGPTFIPIVLLVVIAFVLLSCFAMAIAKSVRDGYSFDLLGNALAYVLPATILMFLDVLYTSFYFKYHQMIAERGKPSKEEIIRRVQEINGQTDQE